MARKGGVAFITIRVVHRQNDPQWVLPYALQTHIIVLKVMRIGKLVGLWAKKLGVVAFMEEDVLPALGV